ncbi:MAG: hypothetical protein K5745_04795 [Saccharofermentans sp.]|nr:hypothetical protein [Saccharofermentans sp.]
MEKTCKGLRGYEIAAVAVCSLAWFFIAFNIPYTHDDWDWGLKIGMDHLINADLNSRYMGNLIEVLMTRSVLLKTLILGLGYSLIPLLIAYFNEKNRAAVYLLGNMFMFFLDKELWSESFGWVAGAANYVMVMPLVICWIYVLKHLLEGRKYKVSTRVLFALLGLVMQLFLENIALAVCLIALAALFIAEDKISTGLVFGGNLAGFLICMFSGTVRDLVGTGSAVEGYRRFVFDMADPFMVKIGKSLSFFFADCMPLIYTKWNMPVCIAILLVLSFIAWNKKNYIFLVLNLVCITLMFIPAVRTFMGVFIFIAVMASLIVLLSDKFACGLWCFPVLVILPMCVLDNWGPRLYITVFLLHLVMLGHLISVATLKLSDSMSKILLMGLCALLVIRMLLMCLIYFEIGRCSASRASAISDAGSASASEVYLDAFPHEMYLYEPDPETTERMEYFKAFYGIPEDMDVIIG